MATSGNRTFRSWLENELTRQGVKRRELARRLARKHPQGETTTTIETYRRAIYKYLDPSNPTVPNQSTRAAFAEALGVPVEEVPSEDEDEDLDLAAAVQAMAREMGRLQKLVRTRERV